MILTEGDIREFEEQAELANEAEPESEEAAAYYAWLSNHPQVLMCFFQEFVAAHELSVYQNLVRQNEVWGTMRPVFRKFEGQWLLISNTSCDAWDAYDLAKVQATTPTELEADPDFIHTDCIVALPGTFGFLEIAKKYVDNPLLDPTSFVSPRLWTPERQSAEKDHLLATARGLIVEIQKEKQCLSSITWQQLEDIVAELFRAKGLEIAIARNRPQGGRDVLARGELIPGTGPVTIAIEVKHRSVVDRPLVERALQQNRQFPALLFVTSGRFTSGVIREASLPENRLRLFLHDGVAVRNLIRNYRLD